MATQKDTVIFDIDGTLCDSFKNGYSLKPLDWNAVEKEMPGYPVVEALREIADHFFSCGYTVVLFSGRPERYRELTKTWLWDKEIPYEHLFLRPDGDEREDAELKSEMLDALIKTYGYKVLCVFEDRTSVVKMFRERGLTCLQPAQGDY